MSFATNKFPKCYSILVDAQSTFGSANLIEFSGTTAHFIQIVNLDNNEVRCRFNGDEDATFTILANAIHSFNSGDLHIKSIDFATHNSGGTDTSVEVLVGLTND